MPEEKEEIKPEISSIPKEAPEIVKEGGQERVSPEIADQHQQIRQEIEATALPEELHTQTQSQATQMSSMPEDAQLQSLLQMAKKGREGVISAIQTAKKMDASILDKLHDLLANNGYYKQFLK